jgi:DNA-binding response OmpR family regulator
MKVLIVEDDERIAEPLKEELEHQHNLVRLAFDGEVGLKLALEDNYDLILLDVMLPKLSGIEVCQQLRSAGCKSAVLMLTALDKTANKIIGLDAGADDYLVKPFEVDELLARIRAVMRRNLGAIDPLFEFGDVVLDPTACEVRSKGRLISLTPTEYRLLANFLKHPGKIFSKEDLIARLWLPDEHPTESVVKAHIKGLRNKLHAADAPRDMVETVYGFGYRLKRND